MNKKTKMVYAEAGLLVTIESIRDLHLTAIKLCKDAGLMQSHEEAILDYIAASEYDIANALSLLSNGIKSRLKSDKSKIRQWGVQKLKFIRNTISIYARVRMLMKDTINGG